MKSLRKRKLLFIEQLLSARHCLCIFLFNLPNNHQTCLTVPISQKNAAEAETLHTFVWNHTAQKRQVHASGFLLWTSGHGPLLRSQQTFTLSFIGGLCCQGLRVVSADSPHEGLRCTLSSV